MSRFLDFATAASAFVAAVFWFLSAWGKLPPMIAYWDATPESDPLFQAMKHSGLMNAIAAFASGVSALLMTTRLICFPMP
jgi:hypothetical protein